MSAPKPVNLSPGCDVESLSGMLRVKKPGAPLYLFALVRLSDEEQDAHYGRDVAAAMRGMPPLPGDEGAPPVTLDTVSYVNWTLLKNALRERGGQHLVDEVRQAIGMETEAEQIANKASAT